MRQAATSHFITDSDIAANVVQTITGSQNVKRDETTARA
jgi:hypothetical protein